MRLKHYINESGYGEDFDSDDFFTEWWPLIKKNCMPYLKDIKKSGKDFLQREMDSSTDFSLRTVRKDREPTDTPLHIHKYLNSLFKKRFGWNVRSEGVFVWLNRRDLSSYRYLIFPFGNYSIVYCRYVKDLYTDSNIYDVKTTNITDFDSVDLVKDIKLSDSIRNHRLAIIERHRVRSDKYYVGIWKYIIGELINKEYEETTYDKTINDLIVEGCLRCNKYYAIRFSDNYRMVGKLKNIINKDEDI